jgi:hypothetical protein
MFNNSPSYFSRTRKQEQNVKLFPIKSRSLQCMLGRILNYKLSLTSFDKYKFHIALAFCFLFLLSGCKSAELRSLEDSASLIQLTTGREVNRSLQDKGEVFGKPVYAEVDIDYEPIDNHTKREVYEEIVEILNKNQWERDEVNIVPDFFSASLKQDDFKLLISVLIRSSENLVRVEIVNRNR